MEEVDLDKYKSAWKSEESFFDEKLSRDEIMKYMQSASKNIGGLFRKSLILDVIVKIVLSVSFCGLLVLYFNQYRILPVIAVFIAFTICCIVFQMKTFKKIPEVKNADQSLKTMLYSYVDFYRKDFVLSVINSSFSASLFVINGVLYYFYYKYGTVRSLQYDDFLVMGTIIIVSFLFSAFFQMKNFNFHINQLNENLYEIEQESMNQSKLLYYKKIHRRNIILYGVFIFIGLILLIVFLLQVY